MRRTLLAALLLMCLTPAAHAAQGMNLRWNSCLADGGVRNRTFACNTNTGSEQLFLSFKLDSAFAPVTGIEFSLQLTTPAGPPGSWWQFKNVGTCRQTALSASAIGFPSGPSCVDYWQGQASGGLTAFLFSPFPPSRMLGVFAVPEQAWAALDPGTEYYAARLAITHAKTVGTASCQGCLDPVCIGLERIKLTRPAGVGNLTLSTETETNSSTVNWQGGSAGSTHVVDIRYFGDQIIDDSRRDLTCAAAVPARNGTWGSIKSLYH